MGTSRIRLGAGILPVFIRSPWIVAAGAATVDEVSGGRFMLGLGAGHKSVIEDHYGLAYDRPAQRLPLRARRTMSVTSWSKPRSGRG